MSFPQKPLGSIIEPSGKARAGNNNYPVLSITMKNGLVDQSEKFKKRVASQNTSTYKVAFENELVVGFPIDEGVLGFQTRYQAGIVSPAYGIWKLKSPKDTHIPYLERYLRSPQARHLYSSKMQGAVARRRSIKNADFVKIEIPFPDKTSQIKIADILERIENLVTIRQESINQLTALTQSTFIQMFGDPVDNDKNWGTKLCNVLIPKIVSGTSYGGDEKEALESDELGVLKISAVTQGVFKSDEFKAVKKSNIKKKLIFVKKNDLLFSRANTRELVAACAVIDKDYDDLFLPDKLWRLDVNKELVTPQFINHLLKNDKYRANVTGLASGGHKSMLNISMKKFHCLNMITPPLSMQKEFSSIIEKLDVLRGKYQRNLKELEKLYGALSQKAFKGELELSKIELPELEPESSQNEFVKAENRAPITVDLPTAIKPEARPQPTFSENKIRPLINVANDNSYQEKSDIEEVLALSQYSLEQWQPSNQALTFSEYPMSDPATRTNLILSAFNEFISFHKGKALPIEQFWSQLEISTVDYMDEGVQPIGSFDYDVVKKRLFELIRNNKIVQVFDDEKENKMELKVVA